MSTTMKALLTFTLILAVGLVQAKEAAPDAEGFVPLFNGKNLDGWKTTGNWVVE